MGQKAASVLHEKMKNASKSDEKKIQKVYQQLSYWIGNFTYFGEAEYKLMLKYFMNKIDEMVIEDKTIVSHLKNSVQTKLKNKKRKIHEDDKRLY